MKSCIHTKGGNFNFILNHNWDAAGQCCAAAMAELPNHDMPRSAARQKNAIFNSRSKPASCAPSAPRLSHNSIFEQLLGSCLLRASIRPSRLRRPGRPVDVDSTRPDRPAHIEFVRSGNHVGVGFTRSGRPVYVEPAAPLTSILPDPAVLRTSNLFEPAIASASDLLDPAAPFTSTRPPR